MIEILELGGDVCGYEITNGTLRIRQLHQPAFSGMLPMNREQAADLAQLVETKFIEGLAASVTKQQITDLFAKSRTIEIIIQDEKDAIVAAAVE